MPKKGKTVNFVSHSPEETLKFGALLGELARPGNIFLLIGDLGAGKTCLTQGIARGLNIKETVISPSFVLVREHKGRIPLFHIDLYRLDRIEEIINLGLEQYLDNGGLSVIEWADKGLTILPQDNLLIEFSYISANQRNLVLKPKGEDYLNLISKIKENLKQWN